MDNEKEPPKVEQSLKKSLEEVALIKQGKKRTIPYEEWEKKLKEDIENGLL